MEFKAYHDRFHLIKTLLFFDSLHSRIVRSFRFVKGVVLSKTRSHVLQSTYKCTCCSSNHHISKCEGFPQKTAQQDEFTRQNKLCYNYLKSCHFTSKCPNRFKCSQCHCSYHPLLHSTNNFTSDNEKFCA